MKKNQDKGFTLVELLIVIVILGILATVTVFAVRGITDQGQTNACAVEEKTVLTAAEAYYGATGNVPASVQVLFDDGYLSDAGAVANFSIATNTATSGQVVTTTALAAGDCA